MPPPSSRRFSLPRRGPWLALLSVLAIGAMPFLVCPRLEKARAESRGEEALAALSTCLGAPRDDATLRGRAITAELTGRDWPASCQEPAAHLEVALAALHRQSPPRCEGQCCAEDAPCRATRDARQALERVRAALESKRFEDGAVERLFEASAALLTGEPTGEPPPTPDALPAIAQPPRPSPRASRSDGALARGGYDVAALVAADDGEWRLLLHARDKHAVVCDVDRDAASARCRPLPPSIPIADSVLLVDGIAEAPLSVLAREDDAVAPERWGLYDAATGARKLALDHDALGATSSPEGVAAALVHDGAGYFVVSAEGAPLPVDDRASLGPPLLLGPWLFTARDDGGRMQVRAQALTWQGASPSLGEAEAIADVAAWPKSTVRMQGCRSATTTAIAVAAEPPQPEPQVLVAIHASGRWRSQTVTVDDPWFGLACHGDGATLTTVTEEGATKVAGGHRGRYVVTRQRCDATACRHDEGAIEATRRRAASRYLAASIGDAVALIWRSGIGDVRLAASAPTTLGNARVRTAFEGDDHGGYDFDRHGAELIARDGLGLLLVAREEAGDVGTHGFLIGADASLRPLTVAR